MERVLRQDEPGALLRRQPSLDQGEIEIGVAPVKLVAHDGVPQMGQMQPELVLASRQRAQGKKGEGQGTPVFRRLISDL